MSHSLHSFANYSINFALLLGYEEVHIYPKLQIKEVLESAQIKCESKVRPQWTKDGRSLPRHGLIFDDSGNTLSIHSAMKTHTGVYECSGTSYSGEPFIANAKLLVGDCEFGYGIF